MYAPGRKITAAAACCVPGESRMERVQCMREVTIHGDEEARSSKLSSQMNKTSLRDKD